MYNETKPEDKKPVFSFDPDDLQSVLKEVNRMLTSAVDTRGASFRLFSLVTWDGEYPHSRTVVLRNYQADVRALVLYSDSRAQKIWQIEQHPQVACLFYDPELQVQLRFTGIGKISSTSNEVDKIWKEMPAGAKKMYTAPRIPGSLQETPTPNLPEALIERDPNADECKTARENFAVVKITWTTLDWLYLKKSGHVRAKFKHEDGEQTASWCAT